MTSSPDPGTFDPSLPSPMLPGGYPAEPPRYPQGAAPAPAGYPGYQPGYQPGFQPYAPGYLVPTTRNGMGTAALVLGIIGVVLFWAWFIGLILNALAIIFGAVGLGRVKRGQATNRGAALAGLILGIVGAALFVLVVMVATSIVVGVTNS